MLGSTRRDHGKSFFDISEVDLDFVFHIVFVFNILQLLEVGDVLFWIFLSLSGDKRHKFEVIGCECDVE